MSEAGQNVYLLTQLLASSMNKIVHMAGRSVNVLSAARLGVAIERHRQENGSLPSELSALVPGFIDAIPNDAFTGEQLDWNHKDTFRYSIEVDEESPRMKWIYDPIQTAVETGNLDALKAFAANGWEITQPNADTPESQVTRRRVIDYSAPETVILTQQNALHHAVHSGSSELVQWLIEQGVDTNGTAEIWPPHDVGELSDNGADVFSLSMFDDTPIQTVLEFAVSEERTGMVKMLLGAGVLFVNLGQEFVPQLDEGDIAMHAMRIPGTGIEQSTRMQLEVERAVAKLDEVELVFSKTGTADLAADSMPPSVSDTFIIFKPRAEWPEPHLAKRAIELKVSDAVRDLVGNKYEFSQPIKMRFQELIAGVRGDLAVKVFGENPGELRRTAEKIAAVMRGVPGAADVKVEQTTGMPELTVRPKLGAIARYGLDAADVVESVNIAIGGRAAGQVFDGDRRFDIVVRLPEAKRRQAATLAELPILLPSDGDENAAFPPVLPLGELAAVVQTEGPFQVSRENSKRRVVAQCNVRGRDLAGFVSEVRERVNSDVKLPAGAWLDWGGQFENLTAARQRLAIVVPACFALIFLLLHAAFGAVRPALLVFTAVPLALTGGVAALWLRGLPFSISAAVGFIALSGVAVLNGLVLVTFINQLREQGRPLEAAIREGALTRLRPVLMTALVASLGFLPMALATGTGAEVQRPLATVVIGGILTATALTLVVLPALCQRVLRRQSER